MEIKTKYNIGDEVWTIINGKCRCLTIERIYATLTPHIEVNKYGFQFNPYIGQFESVEEVNLFSSKEELLNSL